MFQSWVLGYHKSETVAGIDAVVTGSRRWSWMVSQMGHQGVDQMEVLPACIWYVVLLQSSFLTCIREAQKIDLVPVVLVVQKEVLGKYLDFRTAVSKGFLLLAMLKAACTIRLLLTM
jgi:hypothetical protein